MFSCEDLSQMPILMECQNPWFDAILSGGKTIEGRKAEKWSHLKVNDVLQIHLPDFSRSFLVCIVKINHYDSLVEYVSSELLSTILPGINSVENGIMVYENFGMTIHDKMIALHLMKV